MRALALAFTTFASLVAPAHAEGVSGDRITLGYGRHFNNDFFGDHADRWRTGSYVFSILRGRDTWDGQRPDAIGSLLEYRLRTEIIAPRFLSGAGSDDRPYVGAVSVGVHTHFQRAGTEFSLGADVLATGPQTGVGDLQEWFHELVSAPRPTVLGAQIANGFHAAATAEIGRPVRVSDRLTFRPFAEAQAGVENLVRVGGDVIIGRVGQEDLWLRDVPTGQLYRGVEGTAIGFGYVLGADVAYVDSSIYLPESRGFFVEDTRTRARGGVHWQFAENASFYYGATYLSPEFVGQPEGQVVGSLKLNFNF